MRKGSYYYRVYDVKTNKLLAAGSCKDVAIKMHWELSYPSRLFYQRQHHPDAKPRFERIEREYIEYIFHIYDCNTGHRFAGNYDSCVKWVKETLGHDLAQSTIERYMYNISPRFTVMRSNNA